MYRLLLLLIAFPVFSCNTSKVSRTDTGYWSGPAIQYDAVTEAAVYNSIQKQDTVFLNKEGEVTGIGKVREN